jgi:hypothetical protein
LGQATKDIYINVPEAPVPDSVLADSKKECLASAMERCELEAISENDYQKKTIVTSCTCDNLKRAWDEIKSGCLGDISSMFCECYEGTSYPQGCGCNLQYSVCVTCCNAQSVKSAIESSCDARVICE